MIREREKGKQRIKSHPFREKRDGDHKILKTVILVCFAILPHDDMVEIKRRLFIPAGIFFPGRENTGLYFSEVILYSASGQCYAFITVRGSPELMRNAVGEG